MSAEIAKTHAKKASPLLGRRKTAGVGKRVSEGLRRARAEGKPLGQPRIHPIFDSICETCGKDFKWTRGQYDGMSHQTTGRFCSKRCLVKWLHKYRQLLPHADEIKRLYWEEKKSLWEIARRFGVTDQSTVKKAMAKAGIPRRPKKNIGKKVCIVSGCGQRAHKIRHSNNGSPYGRRCYTHWKEHREQLGKSYYARHGGTRKLPGKILQALANGPLTAHDIAQSSGLTHRTVSNTLAHMRKAGTVDIIGIYRDKKRGANKWPIWKATNERTIDQPIAA